MGRVSAQTRMPALAGDADRLERCAAGEVHDVDLGADQRRVVDGAPRGLGLGQRGAALRVVPRVQPPRRQHRAGAVVEHVAVLGVHVDDGSRVLGRAEQPEEGRVTDAELVDHEHLEAGIPGVDKPRDLRQPSVAGVRDDDVKAVIDVGPAGRPGLPRFHRRDQRLPARLPGVIADGGDPAAHRRRRAGLEVVGRPNASDLGVEMRVDIDPAGKDQEALGRDLLQCRGQRRGDRHHLASSHADVRGEAVRRRDHRAAPHDQVVVHRASALLTGQRGLIGELGRPSVGPRTGATPPAAPDAMSFRDSGRPIPRSGAEHR